jgi:hypothetical protein
MRLVFRRRVLLTEHVIASSVFCDSSKQFKQYFAWYHTFWNFPFSKYFGIEKQEVTVNIPIKRHILSLHLHLAIQKVMSGDQMFSREHLAPIWHLFTDCILQTEICFS